MDLKFHVPAAVRADVASEMVRRSATSEHMSLSVKYLDTDDRRLAREGISWELRREGRRWIQTLKTSNSDAVDGFEHEVVSTDGGHDPALHSGTAAGHRLMAVLKSARKAGVSADVRFQTQIRRTVRRIRTRGAVVDVAFDEGRLLSVGVSQRVRELEFELVSGLPASMLALVERWRKQFGLIYDPRSKAERGDLLADGSLFPRLRKAIVPCYSGMATATEAFGAVLDECLSQVSRNAVGLIAGDPTQRVAHVHQLRVGIRRTRSALQSFQGWTPSPPAELIEGLRALFATLGMARDSDVLDSGVVAELARVGAPQLTFPAAPAGPDPVEAVRSAETQRLLLAWIAWRTGLADASNDGLDAAGVMPSSSDPLATTSSVGADATAATAAAVDPIVSCEDRSPVDAANPWFLREVTRRLRRWHRRIANDWKGFDALDEPGLHALRKRIKRQRYAVEFFAPVLRRRHLARYLSALTRIQDRMGELNDLFVARTRYQSLVDSDPAAWFAVGWLSARIAEVRALAKPELARLAKTDTPTC